VPRVSEKSSITLRMPEIRSAHNVTSLRFGFVGLIIRSNMQ
jgi:hypothetical protein